jgi:hypothetical protein
MQQEPAAVMTMRRGPAWTALILLVLTTFALVFIPAWIIQPFRTESPSGVQLAYALKRISPIGTLLALLLTSGLAVMLWRPSRRWWRKGLLVFAVLFTAGFSWLARQNQFEWMFHPLPHSSYARVAEATFVGAGDMVLGVTENGDSAAYPIRQMGYHHVVHDMVGGVPIVVTY